MVDVYGWCASPTGSAPSLRNFSPRLHTLQRVVWSTQTTLNHIEGREIFSKTPHKLRRQVGSTGQVAQLAVARARSGPALVLYILARLRTFAVKRVSPARLGCSLRGSRDPPRGVYKHVRPDVTGRNPEARLARVPAAAPARRRFSPPGHRDGAHAGPTSAPAAARAGCLPYHTGSEPGLQNLGVENRF